VCVSVNISASVLQCNTQNIPILVCNNSGHELLRRVLVVSALAIIAAKLMEGSCL
jgi:hypothetical protein